MNKPADAAHTPAIEIRFGQVGLLQVRIRTTDPEAIFSELSDRISAAPRFFERTAVCLDVSSLPAPPAVEELRTVVEAVRRAGMLSVGLAHGAPTVDSLSAALDLPVLTQFRVQAKPVPVVQPAKAAEPSKGAPALMHHHTVRSGQRLYARNRDLVVTATVGAGAEVMADGCVHVYGTLRGRAMAGARGDVKARVFCQEFHAELVSIAGVFRVFETIPEDLAGKPVQAWLDGDDLHFARIGA
jgi:septum site-determining protein MinC